MLATIAVGAVAGLIMTGVIAFARAMIVVYRETTDLKEFHERFPPPPRPVTQVRSGCGHGQLVEVTALNSDYVLAYLCVKCDEQIDHEAPAAIAYRQRQQKEEARKRADAEFSAMFRGPSARQQAMEEQKLRILGLAVEGNRKGLLSDESTKNIVNREV
jgi:hypothetical protein